MSPGAEPIARHKAGLIASSSASQKDAPPSTFLPPLPPTPLFSTCTAASACAAHRIYRRIGSHVTSAFFLLLTSPTADTVCPLEAVPTAASPPPYLSPIYSYSLLVQCQTFSVSYVFSGALHHYSPPPTPSTPHPHATKSH